MTNSLPTSPASTTVLAGGDVRKPAGFPLYGPPERWISNPLRLITLQEIDRDYAASGLPTRHEAEIASLLCSDLSLEVGRYYPDGFDSDEAAGPERQAEYRRRVGAWLASGGNSGPALMNPRPETAERPIAAVAAATAAAPKVEPWLDAPPSAPVAEPSHSATPAGPTAVDPADADSVASFVPIPDFHLASFRQGRGMKRLRTKLARQGSAGQRSRAPRYLLDDIFPPPDEPRPSPRRRKWRSADHPHPQHRSPHDFTFTHAVIPPDNSGPEEVADDEQARHAQTVDDRAADELSSHQSVAAQQPRVFARRPTPKPPAASRTASGRFISRLILAELVVGLLFLLLMVLTSWLALTHPPDVSPPAAAESSPSTSRPAVPPPRATEPGHPAHRGSKHKKAKTAAARGMARPTTSTHEHPP